MGFVVGKSSIPVSEGITNEVWPFNTLKHAYSGFINLLVLSGQILLLNGQLPSYLVLSS